MHQSRPISGVRMGWGVFLTSWALAAVIALALGRDANWDLRNYHYYNAYALLEGRWNLDLAPAGSHTFLNPALDLPFYMMTRSVLNHSPRLIAALQAGYLGLLTFLVLLITNIVCHGDPQRVTGTSALVAAFGLTGAATLPEAGTTFNDLQIACLVVGAVLALLLAARADDVLATGRAARLRLLSGVLGGAAIGLKLTAMIFPPALMVTAMIAGPFGMRRQLRTLVLLGSGGAVGFLLTGGPWAWFLLERFGNPFGPFLNEVFHSPWFPQETIRDTRFLPSSAWQALIYPLLWARRSAWLVTEWPVADPRLAVGLVALLIASAAGMWRCLAKSAYNAPDDQPQQHLPMERLAAQRASWAVMGFIVAGYVAWLAMFSILRYAGPVEALLGVPVWAMGRDLLLRRAQALAVAYGLVGTKLFYRIGTGWVAIVLGACALATLYPEWNRQPFHWVDEPQGAAAVAVTHVTLPPEALVAMVGPAVSFTAPFITGSGVRFIGAPHPGEAGPAAFRTAMAEAVRTTAQSHTGPAFAIVEDPDDYDREVAAAYGISLDLASCVRLPNNLTTLVHLCRWR
ncbi:hypothetical protein [Muricoccus aerilatus]|uniref:hypothetical protein n=1 Tax=Muricoccus aerilatus TaxID=452982 RepID=UPI0012ECA64C|nr:hypothetical protein [Roseomonas aerilata]